MTDRWLAEVGQQLDDDQAAQLSTVLTAFDAGVRGAIGDLLGGVYLKGSFALGAGDVHADVDFLVLTTDPLSPDAEQRVRELHRSFPDRPEHWAHVLEGSYATAGQLRERADPERPWLYVDNGSHEMELSAHDNTEVFRWVLRNRALPISGPPPDTLLPEVPTQALRDEAAAMARRRRADAIADPDYLSDAWGQPHEVLTQCRMLYTATTGTVSGKTASARWCLGVVPEVWHDLIETAVRSRPDPLARVNTPGVPGLTAMTWPFLDEMVELTSIAAAGGEHV